MFLICVVYVRRWYGDGGEFDLLWGILVCFGDILVDWFGEYFILRGVCVGDMVRVISFWVF